MADEISYNSLITLTNGALTDSYKFSKNLVTQTASGIFKNVWTVGTTEETLTVSDISTMGIVYFVNLDTTNFVQIGKATGSYFCRLKPSASDIPACFRLEPGITIYAKADTSPVKVLVAIYEN